MKYRFRPLVIAAILAGAQVASAGATEIDESVAGQSPAAEALRHAGSGLSQRDFGPNVIVFDSSMPISEIQAKVDAITAQQIDSEMGNTRYALLFKPGTYGSATQPLIIQVGYYTDVAGLGANPNDVVINGHVDVYNRCLTPTIASRLTTSGAQCRI